ncbi:MAG: ATP-binding protein [Reichenbachiella sp.]|uniref:ATP-binding protein n=1 Tax=Reichenbachiella sp. TaxID=2184521 RepID=UPI002965D78C|nr:ATP-binding protein [Reichenbachiella sp.]MDW3208915.1 ATP-binding protein [Reichenbachiella sp.]
MEHIANLNVGTNIISTYKRLSYKPWYAFAEFIDNSTQSYLNNKSALDSAFSESKCLEVIIDYSRKNSHLSIEDNAMGMDLDRLTHALHIGDTKYSQGRSKYGLGLKTAACWFGDRWSIRTSMLGIDKEFSCTVDVNEIIENGDDSISILETSANANDHYTIIEIHDLHRVIHGNTIRKIKNYLERIYYLDINNNEVIIKFQGSELEQFDAEEGLYITKTGEKYKKSFSFSIGEANTQPKQIEGWVSAILPGSREKAGFTIQMNDRVVVCPPAAYKPETIFGHQLGGSNTLVNQRVIGILNLTGFDVSHQKDAIIWEGDDENELADKLLDYAQEAIEIAENESSPTKTGLNLEASIVQAVGPVKQIVESKDFYNAVEEYLAHKGREEELEEIFLNEVNSIKSAKTPFFTAEVDLAPRKLSVKFFSAKNSDLEPYLYLDFSGNENEIIGVVNLIHPYFDTFKNYDQVQKFLEQCAFDAIAEWKCRKLYNSLRPNIFREIKDKFFRIPIQFN